MTTDHAQQRPNVLLIVTDDQRYDTVAALGNPYISTPALDRLAREGFAFRRHFCTTPICTPARAEILTGCDSFRNRVPWFGMQIDPSLATLPRTLRDAGYYTIHVGKWHNDGHPRDRGFNSTRCVFPEENLNDRSERGQWMRFSVDGDEVEGHSTEIFTTAAIEEIAASPSGVPWFCYLGYHAPHDPHDSPPPFDTFYNADSTPLFPNHMPEHPIDNGAMHIRDELLEPWPRRQDSMRRYRSRYYGIISHLDHHVGRLLGHPGVASTLENTIVVFTGDQGLAAGSHGLLGKENMYDHSIASPLILRGPGIAGGRISEAMSHQMDLHPTICELTGTPVPETVEGGLSLVPILEGRADRVREEILCEFCIPRGAGTESLAHVQRAIRTERWKLVWHADARQYQLFDLERDADEVCNLLATWRRRFMRDHAAGKCDYRNDRWAAWNPHPVYAEAEIDAVATDLWQRLIRLMERQEDWMPRDAWPPPPVLEEPERLA